MVERGDLIKVVVSFDLVSVSFSDLFIGTAEFGRFESWSCLARWVFRGWCVILILIRVLIRWIVVLFFFSVGAKRSAFT